VYDMPSAAYEIISLNNKSDTLHKNQNFTATLRLEKSYHRCAWTPIGLVPMEWKEESAVVNTMYCISSWTSSKEINWLEAL